MSLWKRGGRELIARFSGVSMSPTIMPGTEVLLRCGDQADVGDVVAWIHGDRLVVHRVVGAGPGWLLTCGDAGCLPDPPVTRPADIVGRIVERHEGDRWTTVPPASPSRRRALAIGTCVRVLRISPGLGGALVVGLLLARRWLIHAPRTAAARARSRFRSRPASP